MAEYELTQEQKDTIRQAAHDMAYEDALQNWDYLHGIIGHWLDTMSPIEQAEVCSNDRDLWPELFDFNPETGAEWPK